MVDICKPDADTLANGWLNRADSLDESRRRLVETLTTGTSPALSRVDPVYAVAVVRLVTELTEAAVAFRTLAREAQEAGRP